MKALQNIQVSKRVELSVAPSSDRDRHNYDELLSMANMKAPDTDKQMIPHFNSLVQLDSRDVQNEGEVFDSMKLKGILTMSNQHHHSSQNEEIQVEQMIEAIRIKQKEVEGAENTELLIEITKLVIETKDERPLKLRVHKLIALFLSFYGLWREAEKLLRWNEQFEMSSITNKGTTDVYDSVLKTLEDQKIMSGILKLCCRTSNSNKNEQQQEQFEQGDNSQQDNKQKASPNFATRQGIQARDSQLSPRANKIDSEVDQLQPESSTPKITAFRFSEIQKIQKIMSGGQQQQFNEDINILKGNEEVQCDDLIIETKEVLLVNLIQTFSLRMNVISQEILEWLIQNQKLNIIELLLENQVMSTSAKRTKYEKSKRQERHMLEFLQEYLVISRGLYNNEIELLLNLNENGLQLLSMVYTRFLIKHLKIPANYIVNRSLIKQAISQQNVPLISQMIKYSKEMTQQTLMSNRVQQHVREFLEKADSFVCGIYFLKKMSQKKQRETYSSEYFDNILRVLSRPQSDERFVMELTEHCLHPLVLYIVCSKILLKLSMGKNPFSSEMLKLANFYLSKALNYRDAIYDAREMSLLLFKPIFPSDKPLIKTLRNSQYSNFFTDFFVHPCISYLLEQKFMSTYGWDKKIFTPLTPFSHLIHKSKIKNPFVNNLKSSSSSSSSSYMKSMKSGSGNSFSLESRKQSWCIFNDIELSSQEKISQNNHIFQFSIFTKSVAVRMFLEFFVYLFIAGVMINYLFKFIENFNVFITADQDTKLLLLESTIPTFLEAGLMEYLQTHTMPDIGFNQDDDYTIFNTSPERLCQILLISISYGYQPFMDYFSDNCIIVVQSGVAFEAHFKKVIAACSVIIVLGGNVLQKQVYSYLLGKRSNMIVLDYYDLLIAVICIVFIAVKDGFIPDGLTGGYTLTFFTESTQILKYLACCIVFLLFIKGFLFLIRSQSVGILVRIIILFVKDLSQFTIVLGTILIAFGTLNYILFQNNLSAYSTFQISIYTHIAAVFGAFDFTGQDGIQSIILIVFLFAANIVLMNLLVAILNSRYEKTMLQSEMEYALIVYNDYINYRYHPLYGCMIMLPPPLSIVNLIFGLPAIFLRSRKWNQFALKIEYTLFILIPVSLIFIGLSLLTMPISLIFMAYRTTMYSTQDNLMNARKRSALYKFSISSVRLLTWILLGIPYLLIILFLNDIPLFFKSSFEHVNNKYTFTKNLILDIRVLRYASIISNYLHSSRRQVVNYVEFRRALENKKQSKNESTTFASSKFGIFMNIQAKQLQQLRQTPLGLEGHKLEPEQLIEKNFNGALKKFGDGKVKSQNDCLSLPNVLRAVKYSAIFFRKSKRTSNNISRLLYIVRKKDLFCNLLEQNSSNFFLHKTYSFQNVGINPQQMQ